METSSFDLDVKAIIKIEPEDIMGNASELNLDVPLENLDDNLKQSSFPHDDNLIQSFTHSRSNRLSSKTSIVTSEVNNIYAKPRMHFTGKGIVTKTQPGCTPVFKKKRGRKPKLREKNKVEKVDVDSSLTTRPGQEIIVDVDSSVPNSAPQEIKVEVEVNSTANSESYFYIKKKRDRRFAKNSELNGTRHDYYMDANSVGQTELSISEEDHFPETEGPREESSTGCFLNKKMFKRLGHHSDGLVECTVCFKKMKDTSMKQHFKTHSGAKPFPCSYCGARFTRKGDVDRHRKTIHRNVKPFVCSMCERRFVERKSLISHLQNHDRMLYYTCTTCGFKFGKREYYENHVRFMHPLAEGQSLTEVKDIVEKGLKQLKKLLIEEREETKLGKKSASFCDEDLENMRDEISLNIKLEVDKEDRLSSDESRFDPLTPESGFCQENLEEDDERHLKRNESSVSVDNVSVVKGTLSLSQTVSSQKTLEVQEEEQLVNKAINAAISQAEVVLENIMSTIGNNMTSTDSKTKGSKSTSSKEAQTCNNKETKSIQPKSSEIHINATVGGSLRKFIIQIPSGSNIDATTQQGMDTLVDMVNYLCSGKGELSGPVEVVMHHSV